MLENVCKRVGIESENHYTNIANFGNTGAAGAPTVLSQRWDELQNSVILVAVVGSGLAWGGMKITRE
jgi:3-oxoacyl-[acyl-carrier-protein] synthase-3